MAFPTDEYDAFATVLDRHADSPITGESHTIPATNPYSVELAQLPLRGSIAIAGMTEVAYVPVTSTQFYCNYASATLTFHSAQAGNTVAVSYTAQGSVLRASTINALQTAVQNTQSAVSGILTDYVPRAPTDGNFRLSPDGMSLQLYDPDMGKWRTLAIAGGMLALSVEGFS